MGVSDILDDRFPHGSVRGFNLGCRTSHCPAPISCVEFRTRYSGDYGFWKLVESGMDAAQIVAHEAAIARARKDAWTQQIAHSSGRSKPAAPVRAARGKTPMVWTAEEDGTIIRMNRAGDLDVQIARALHGRSASSVSNRRVALGLGKNKRPKIVAHGTRAGYESGCRGNRCPATPSCLDRAREYWAETRAARRASLTITEYRRWKREEGRNDG